MITIQEALRELNEKSLKKSSKLDDIDTNADDKLKKRDLREARGSNNFTKDKFINTLKSEGDSFIEHYDINDSEDRERLAYEILDYMSSCGELLIPKKYTQDYANASDDEADKYFEHLINKYDLGDVVKKELSKESLEESSKRDDIDAAADDKKEEAKANLEKVIDDADSDRDYKLKTESFNEFERDESLDLEQLDFKHYIWLRFFEDAVLTIGDEEGFWEMCEEEYNEDTPKGWLHSMLTEEMFCKIRRDTTGYERIV